MTLTPWILAASLSSTAAPAVAPSTADTAGYVYAPTEDVVPEIETRNPERHETTVMLRGGMLAGNMTLDHHCDRGACNIPATSYAETPSLTLDASALWSLGRSVRMGVAAGVLPSMKVRNGSDGETDLGTQVSLGLPLEVLIDLSPKLTLVLRAQANVLVLSGGELADDAEALGQACGASTTTCHASGAPYTGYSAEVGTGLRWSFGSVALRADFVAQTYRINAFNWEVGDTAGRFELDGTRGVALAGIEL